MKYLHVTLLIVVFILLSGCQKIVKPVSNKAVSTQKVSEMSVMSILDDADDEENDSSDDGKELYFSDTKGKVFYTKHSGNKTEFRTKVLLNALFSEARSTLPKVSRKKKLNISLEVGSKSVLRDDILSASQSFILDNKRFQLANTDKKTLKILKRVLKSEKDSIYKGRESIKTKEKSDVILFLDAQKTEEKIIIRAKIISKNGTILAKRVNETYITNSIAKNKEWVEVNVPRNNGATQSFEVLRDAVSLNKYSGVTSNKSVSNVAFVAASRYCQEKLQAQLMTPYVFENSRKSLSISRPTSPITVEIIAPYDEDEEDIYYIDGDSINGGDSSIITYHWNSERYFAVSNLFKSKNATFRCMRAK